MVFQSIIIVLMKSIQWKIFVHELFTRPFLRAAHEYACFDMSYPLPVTLKQRCLSVIFRSRHVWQMNTAIRHMWRMGWKTLHLSTCEALWTFYRHKIFNSALSKSRTSFIDKPTFPITFVNCYVAKRFKFAQVLPVCAAY